MKGNKLAISAIVGAGIGLVAGILTAPKSGKETRDDLKRKTDDTMDRFADKRDELLFKAEEVADEVRTKANDAVNNIRNSKR